VRFLLKPGWLAFIAFVIVFAVCCYTLLAPWQFRRNREQQALNESIAASYAHPPQPLAALVPPGTEPTSGIEWRQATVTGRYLPQDQVLVRLRTVAGDPAFEVLTAFRTDQGRTVAVDRGYIRPNSRNQADPAPAAPTGPVTLTGRIRIDESDDEHRPPIVQNGLTEVYAAGSPSLAAVSGQPVDPGYLLLVAGQSGGLGVVPLPSTTDGPFLSYAWQWLTFGLMALLGLGYFIRLELLQRRGDGYDDDFHDAEDGDPVPPSPAPPAVRRDPRDPAPVRVPVARDDALARRYGKARS
jgi:cytochrome oxidase assembly protein ShyY1